MSTWKQLPAFSASLLASMNNDTAAAAEKANVAITDMSDNANKMGTDISLIQNAYNGFAKQNYTMLDNLKLGYGGTKRKCSDCLMMQASYPALSMIFHHIQTL
ncbi:hypothetical protein [Phascolarctobacterium faecium]|uniref:hypothetical protein n=1 Tax=Phascolarctobacterium faecium TaxID=33025 RepID=UPI0039999634